MLEEILRRLDEIDALLLRRIRALCHEREELAELREKIAADFSATNLAFTLGDVVQCNSKQKEGNKKMNFPLGSTQKVPYRVSHIDGAALASGNTLEVVSGDLASATIVPDATPAAGSLASGFIVGGAKAQTGLQITTNEKNAAGTVVDSITILIDVTVAPPPPPVANLAIALGVAVPQ